MADQDIRQIAEALIALARQHHTMLATAESCTGGMIAAALTDIPGSSDVVDRGFVTYSNAAKHQMLGVDPELISTHGAVSEEVVRAMASGAVNQIEHDGGKIAVSISGVAGPGGGSDEKPVGLVWFGCASRMGNRLRLTANHHFFSGDRHDIRNAATKHGLEMITTELQRDA